MEQNLYKLINTEYEIKSVQSDRIKFIYGDSCRIDAFPKRIESFLADYLEGDELKEYMKLSPKERVSVVNKVTRRVTIDQEKKRNQEDLEAATFSMDGFEVLIDVFDKNLENYIFDTTTEEVTDLSLDALKSLLTPKQLGALERHPCKFVYEPHMGDEDTVTEIKYRQRLIKKVNIYQHPEWRKKAGSNSPFLSRLVFSDLPQSAQDFFNHLFPDKKSLNYALDWLFVALTARQGNEHILVLNGPTGTGKTIFCEKLLSALVGRQNWGTAPKNLFESTFNKVLENKRIIYIDEARIPERDYNTVKLYANKTLNIEKKGVDADNATELFFSMAITNNKIGNIFVDPDDRRYSILETTDVKLKKALGEDFPREFVNSLKDEEFVEAIGNFILGRYEEEIEIEQFKGKKFYKFVWRHLAQWQKVICNRVFKEAKEEEEDEIEISSLVSAISANKHIRYDVQPDTVIEFIESYLHEGKHSLGKIIENKNDGEKVLKINPVFMPIKLGEDDL